VARILVFMVFTVLAAITSADTIDISFPELTGDFETGWLPPDTAPSTRSTTFIFPPDIQSMDGMRLVVSGDFYEGVIICVNYIGEPDTSSFTPDLTLIASVPGVIEGFFYATILPPVGSFSSMSTFLQYCCPSGPGNPDLLLGEIVTLELSCEVGLILPCSVDFDSFGTLTEVRLQAVGAVPEDGYSWGGVKALFR